MSLEEYKSRCMGDLRNEHKDVWTQKGEPGRDVPTNKMVLIADILKGKIINNTFHACDQYCKGIRAISDLT